MHMQVRHAFTCVRSAVDHHSVSAGQFQFLRHVACNQEQFAKQRSVFVARVRETRHDFLRHDQNMYWRLGIDIVKRNCVLIFPNDFGRNFAGDDFFENRHEP